MTSGGAELLRPYRKRSSQTAVLTDFDGTLAPIVDDPSEARPLEGTQEVLAGLVGRYQRVAVISGRPVEYLVSRLGSVTGLTLVGLYGLERAVGSRVHVEPEATRWASTIEAVATDADRHAPWGVGVERKGLAVTLHCRTAPQHEEWVKGFASSRAASSGLIAHPGRMSVELRPPIEIDKGTVLRELAAGCSAVIYAGDDVGDLSAFAALRALRAEGLDTLAIAASSEEAPPQLVREADLAVSGPEGVLEVFRSL